MPHFHGMAAVNLGLLLLVCLCAVWRLPRLDRAASIFALLMGLTFVEETLAYYCAIKYHNNIPVLRIFSIVEMAMLSIYFNYCIAVFRARALGWYIAALSILAGLIDLLLLEPIDHLSGFYMNFQALVIISIALFAHYQFLSRHGYRPVSPEPHFWISTVLLFFWSVTYLNWALYDLFTIMLKDNKILVDYSIYAVNVTSHLAIAIIFIRYPKSKAAHAE